MYEYIKLDWEHNFEEEPISILYEVDLNEDRYATRLIDIYADGHTDNLCDKEWGFVTEEPIPLVTDINEGVLGEEFHACIISKETFEKVWRNIE